jgi:hypothetical protein
MRTNQTLSRLRSREDGLDAVHEFLRFQIEDHHTGDFRDVTVP